MAPSQVNPTPAEEEDASGGEEDIEESDEEQHPDDDEVHDHEEEDDAAGTDVDEVAAAAGDEEDAVAAAGESDFEGEGEDEHEDGGEYDEDDGVDDSLLETAELDVGEEEEEDMAEDDDAMEEDAEDAEEEEHVEGDPSEDNGADDEKEAEGEAQDGTAGEGEEGEGEDSKGEGNSKKSDDANKDGEGKKESDWETTKAGKEATKRDMTATPVVPTKKNENKEGEAKKAPKEKGSQRKAKAASKTKPDVPMSAREVIEIDDGPVHMKTKADPWTPREDSLLLQAVLRSRGRAGRPVEKQDEAGDEDWDDIASDVRSRTAVQCLQRYMSLYGDGKSKPPVEKEQEKEPEKKTWTPEEESTLANHMKQSADGRFDPTAVFSALPKWTDLEVRSKWYELLVTLKAAVQSSRPWTKSEEKMLVEHVQKEVAKMKVVEVVVPGRSNAETEEKQRDLMASLLFTVVNAQQWSVSEDLLIVDKMQRSISRDFDPNVDINRSIVPGRSREDVQDRWKKLCFTMSLMVARRTQLGGNGNDKGDDDDDEVEIIPTPRANLKRGRPTKVQEMAAKKNKLSGKGKSDWSTDEKAILQDLVSRHGKNWTKVSSHLPGRTARDCEKKYEWTDDEECVLIAMRAQKKLYGEVSACLPGRSAGDVKHHWESDIKEKFKLYGEDHLVSAATQQFQAGALDRVWGGKKKVPEFPGGPPKVPPQAPPPVPGYQQPPMYHQPQNPYHHQMPPGGYMPNASYPHAGPPHASYPPYAHPGYGAPPAYGGQPPHASPPAAAAYGARAQGKKNGKNEKTTSF